MSEYLQRELISGVTYDITDTHIKVQSEDTCYCNMTAQHYNITEKELKTLYNSVVKLARAKNIKLSFKNHTKEKITDNINGFYTDTQTLNRLYNECSEIYKQIEKRGIHYGTLDDELLAQAGKIANQYVSMFWDGKPIPIITDIYNHLTKLIYSLTDTTSECNIVKIFL